MKHSQTFHNKVTQYGYHGNQVIFRVTAKDWLDKWREVMPRQLNYGLSHRRLSHRFEIGQPECQELRRRERDQSRAGCFEYSCKEATIQQKQSCCYYLMLILAKKAANVGFPKPIYSIFPKYPQCLLYFLVVVWSLQMYEVSLCCKAIPWLTYDLPLCWLMCDPGLVTM